MKILLILTGGTICLFGDSDNLNRALDMAKARRMLVDNFQKSDSQYKNEEFEVIQILDVLSENMTVGSYNVIISSLKGIDFSLYKGVIIAHGTDTLAYTSALMALILQNISIPVFMVSSNRPLNSAGANGNCNFKTAVELICAGIGKGVYVSYKNMDGRMYIHNAAHITQCGEYSEDFFSKDAFELTGCNYITDKDILRDIAGWYYADSKVKGIQLNDIGRIKDDVLLIRPYVGLRYDIIDINESVRIVVHQMYHSQTACTDTPGNETVNSICYFAEKCKNNNIPLFVTPCFKDENIYSSSEKMKKSGVIPLYGMTLEMTYIKALISGTLCKSNEEIIRFMQEK